MCVLTSEGGWFDLKFLTLFLGSLILFASQGLGSILIMESLAVDQSVCGYMDSMLSLMSGG